MNTGSTVWPGHCCGVWAVLVIYTAPSVMAKTPVAVEHLGVSFGVVIFFAMHRWGEFLLSR